MSTMTTRKRMAAGALTRLHVCETADVWEGLPSASAHARP